LGSSASNEPSSLPELIQQDRPVVRCMSDSSDETIGSMSAPMRSIISRNMPSFQIVSAKLRMVVTRLAWVVGSPWGRSVSFDATKV
jgi:hypothetical protein